jgi:amidase
MITLKKTLFKLSSDDVPIAKIKSGETALFETLDAFSGQIKDETTPLCGINWGFVNPATGPLYIEGAEPGDVLKVEILKIALCEQGVVAEVPGEAITGHAVKEETTKIVRIERGMAIFNDKLAFPISPMIGVIGTAPKDSVIDTGCPGPHGANMDNKRIQAGTTLYLPVNVNGALLSIGDLYAVMGDGEVCITGVEIPGYVTVRVFVVKNCKLPTPFLVTPKDCLAIYSDNTLDEAAFNVTLRMREFLINEVGVDEHEAGMLLSLCGELCICQAVDPLKTCRMEVPMYVINQYGYEFD